ncbi:MAG: EamA family transporter [Candidatus Micrarchaeota archaeon]|nr:EamA family transporter [Candidatus Micrarchaeota archaeon]
MSIYEVMLLTLIAALISSLAQLSFKRSVKKIDNLKHLLGLLRNRGVLLGLLGYVVGFLIYIVALSGGQLSAVYPVFASSFIFVTLISAKVLKERITLVRAVGVLLVFIGISIVAVS